MANKKFWLGILVMVLVYGLTVVGCGDGSDNGGGGGFIGETLNLSGQVWDEGWEQFTGNRTIIGAGFWVDDEEEDDSYFNNIGGSGSIVNGQLNFTIGTPSATVNILEYFIDIDMGESFNNFNISASNANIASFGGYNGIIGVTGDGNTGGLGKEWYDDNTEEVVWYFYVDRNVVITGGGKTTTGEGYTEITRNLNLNLKAGWNVITIRQQWNESTNTTTVTAGDSSRARWMLRGEEEDWD